jgi:ArpU family phage transcriptional regulator
MGGVRLKQMSFLPDIDRKATQIEMESHFEQYRLFKYLAFDEREASITASTEERFHGPTNVTSDQTSNIAIYNADMAKYRKNFIFRTERAVEGLPDYEKFLIKERYMSIDSDYLTDQNVYNHKFKPPISEKKYAKLRWKAFYKLAISLNIAVLSGEE